MESNGTKGMSTPRGAATRHVSGWIFRCIREQCGYSRLEFAKRLKADKMEQTRSVSSESGVRLLEEKTIVPERYINALRRLVGQNAYDKWLTYYQDMYPNDGVQSREAKS